MDNVQKKKRLIDSAMGREECDLILKGGQVVDVFCGRVFRADVAIKDGYICGVGEYDGKNTVDVSGKYLIPGLIDAHMHVESSLVSPEEYARTAIAHGVTTVVADPHEIANVCGETGLRFMKDNAQGADMDIMFALPSCVPATDFEHSGAHLDSKDTIRLSPEFFCIGEMMNYPAICGGNEEVLAKLCKDVVDGHAPLVSKNMLDAYTSAGIKTDHECSSSDEMLEKISKGMYIAMREGTLSKDLSRLCGGVNSYTLRRCMFCTDDRFVGEIYESGSVDNCIRRAVELGISPVDAIIIATLNTAECYGMSKKGAIAPSYIADIVVADSLCLDNISAVYKNGVLVAKDGKAIKQSKKKIPAEVQNTVHIDKMTASDFACEVPKKVVAIELIAHSIINKKVEVEYSGSLSKVCVIERHKGLGTKGFGYVTNYNIKNGAIVSSVSHDSHNVVVIGDNDEDMALAVNTIGTQGGIAVCSRGKVLSYLPLDIAGLMSSESAEFVTKKHKELEEAAKTLGINEDVDPFLALEFLALPVIPELRITDMGAFDVTKFEFVK